MLCISANQHIVILAALQQCVDRLDHGCRAVCSIDAHIAIQPNHFQSSLLADRVQYRLQAGVFCHDRELIPVQCDRGGLRRLLCRRNGPRGCSGLDGCWRRNGSSLCGSNGPGSPLCFARMLVCMLLGRCGGLGLGCWWGRGCRLRERSATANPKETEAQRADDRVQSSYRLKAAVCHRATRLAAIGMRA